jgi:hypothetical protein
MWAHRTRPVIALLFIGRRLKRPDVRDLRAYPRVGVHQRLDDLGKACRHEGLHTADGGHGKVVICRPKRDLFAIDPIDDIDLPLEGWLRQPVDFGGVPSTVPHPNLAVTATSREGDVLMLGLSFEGAVGVYLLLGAQLSKSAERHLNRESAGICGSQIERDHLLPAQPGACLAERSGRPWRATVGDADDVRPPLQTLLSPSVSSPGWATSTRLERALSTAMDPSCSQATGQHHKPTLVSETLQRRRAMASG